MMFDLNMEREAFEALPQIKGILAGGNVYFSTLSMNYTSKKTALEHCVYFINGAWYAWMEKATAQEVPALQQQIKVLTVDLKESQSDFAYAYKSVKSWTERAYKQREKVELIKNEVARFQQSGTPLDLNQFLNNLIELATFKNDHEFADHLLVPTQKFFSHDFNGDGFKYHDSLEEAQKEAEASLDWYRDKVADGHHVANDGEFLELCYGAVIASAAYTVDKVVTEDHHKNDEFTKYEVGTEILSLHFNECNSESGAEG
ncbi:hypothetical protein R4579_15520 [Acinetobacter baumannii]|nr:hypothetical protein [Acinetobacter baumannii]